MDRDRVSALHKAIVVAVHGQLPALLGNGERIAREGEAVARHIRGARFLDGQFVGDAASLDLGARSAAAANVGLAGGQAGDQ